MTFKVPDNVLTPNPALAGLTPSESHRSNAVPANANAKADNFVRASGGASTADDVRQLLDRPAAKGVGFRNAATSDIVKRLAKRPETQAVIEASLEGKIAPLKVAQEFAKSTRYEAKSAGLGIAPGRDGHQQTARLMRAVYEHGVKQVISERRSTPESSTQHISKEQGQALYKEAMQRYDDMLAEFGDTLFDDDPSARTTADATTHTSSAGKFRKQAMSDAGQTENRAAEQLARSGRAAHTHDHDLQANARHDVKTYADKVAASTLDATRRDGSTKKT